MIVVLIAAAGAGWEPEALAVLEGEPGMVVLRRCVDIDDLLAAAAAGQADAAVVGIEAPGLDASAVDQLRRAGCRPVAVVPPSEAATARAARIGVGQGLREDDIAGLPALLRTLEEVSTGATPRAGSTSESGSPPGASPGPSRVVVVWGPAGAPGRTTVAVGVAAELARRGLATVLIDADPHGGTVAQQLGVLDEVSGLLAAARESSGIDLTRLARRVGEHLELVTGLPRPDRWAEVRLGVLPDLVETARAGGYVVVDTGFSLEHDGTERPRNQLTLEGLGTAEELVVVGAADPVGLARLARGLGELREITDLRPHVLVNRMRSSLGWSQREVAGMLGDVTATVSIGFLPEDRAVDRALMAGRALAEIAPDAPLCRALGNLTDRLAPPPRVGDGALRRRRAGRDHRR